MARDGINITDLSIPVPGIGGDTGADAANAIVVSLDAIDLHDHTEDKGSLITSAAININDTLDFNGQAASSVKQITFSEQGSSPTDLNSMYAKSDGELYYRDDAGSEVKLTDEGKVNVGGTGTLGGVTVGSSAGINYTEGSYAWSAAPHNGTAGAFANFNMRDLRLNGATSGVLAIKPADVIVSYNLTLPGGAPSANQFLMSDGSGIFSWQNACVNGASGSAEKLAVWSSATTLKGVGPLTDGQLLIGATSAAPAPGTITGTANRITVTNGTNSITLNTPQDLHTSASVQFSQATLTTLAGSPTAALGNTTITGTLNVTGNVTLTTMTGTGTRVAYVSSSGQFTPGVAAAATNTANTIMLRGASGETAMGALTCTSVSSSGALSGTSITGSSLNVSSGTIAGGAITGSSLNVGSGAVTAGAVGCTSVSSSGSISASENATITGSLALAGCPGLKIKRLTSGATNSTTLSISHGLSWLKIVGVYGSLRQGEFTKRLIPCGDGVVPSAGVAVDVGTTSIGLRSGYALAPWGFGGLDPEAVILYVIYEA
jgi:hypothetical protein